MRMNWAQNRASTLKSSKPTSQQTTIISIATHFCHSMAILNFSYTSFRKRTGLFVACSQRGIGLGTGL